MGTGLYEFKEQDAYDFAHFKGIETRKSGDELQFKYCPYCNGGSGYNRDMWTFAINLQKGAFNCKRDSCNAVGNMISLSRNFDFSLGKIADEYFKPRKVYRKFKKPTEPIKPTESSIAYLQGERGISEETIKRYEITTKKEQDNVLVFPFYDERGNLQFIKYRKTDFKKGVDKSKEWCESQCKPILFGMNQCNLENQTLIITEGQIDSMSVADCGIDNAVSVPLGCNGFTFIPYVWNWMQNFDTIIVFGDYDGNHMTLLDEFARRFGQKIKHVRYEDYLDCKDANDLMRKYGKDQVRACIENAVALPVKQVIDLCDVEDVDIYAIEKVETGIKQLDRLLCGGLPFGGVHLITAKAGSGKSTFASQILIRAKKQGYKCFAYSGELPNYLFKSWMNFQVAGRKCIFEYQNPSGTYQGYSISKTNKQLISEWYKGYIYLYDNSAIYEESETQGLLKIVERVIQQYGVRVILLDNLMTAMIMDDNGNGDDYSKQTTFVNRLRVIALRYNVMILLVAHMRKNNFEQTTNDEVAGSSNITNLAMLTISYDRGRDLGDNERFIKLLKNRLFGKLDFKGIQVEYDERSKRIYGEGDNQDFDYGFDPSDTENYQQEEEWHDSYEGLFT